MNKLKSMMKAPVFGLNEVSKKGAYVRSESVFRNWIKKGGEFPPEANRYHLYISYACPWASRCLAAINMKGLQNSISFSVVEPIFTKTKPDDPSDEHLGWVFSQKYPDEILGCKTVRDIYAKMGNQGGKYTVPILFDKKAEKIVSNESSEILRMFNTEFNDLAKNPDLDLYPKKLQKEIDDVNEWVYPHINNGVYRCGFARTQDAYDEAVHGLFEHLDKAEEILSKQRYIASPTQFTEADLRLFVTLVRFDEVYVTHFKCNKKRIADYPNLEHYVREIYQMEGVEETVNMDHIITHYYKSHASVNPFAIIPVGPGVDYTLPHDRNEKFPLE